MIKTAILLLMVILLAACAPPAPATPAQPTPILPATPAQPSPILPATPTSRPRATPTSAPTDVTEAAPSETAPEAVTPTESPGAEQPQEAILILEPGPGSRLTSPLRVTGEADSTFEQNLVVRILLDDGSEVAIAPTTIQTEMGQRGPFEAELSFTISGERQAFIQVLSASPRDGGITHLASVGVLLAESGASDIRPVEPYAERIQITNLVPGDSVSGGVAHVEGIALASFEQTLVAEVLDENAVVIGSQSIIVNAPDLGQPGPYSADVPYSVSAAGPGRIVVRDPSPAFTGDVHLASVEVTLNP